MNTEQKERKEKNEETRVVTVAEKNKDVEDEVDRRVKVSWRP